MPFPNQVNLNQAPAVDGDFASSNPRFSLLGGGQAYVAGSSLTAGNFAWVDVNATNSIANSFGSGAVAGYIHREQQAFITTYLGEVSSQVLPGVECTIMNGGDFWMKNQGTLVTTPGMKVYAKYTDGSKAFGPSGSPPNAAVVTGSVAAQAATSVTASIAQVVSNNAGAITQGVMSVTAVGSGAIVVGGTLSGTGVQAGTIVVAQLTGTAGGIGTYLVNIPQTVASTTITQASGLFTVTAVASGVIGVGDVLSGTNITGTPVVTALGTGTGGTGTYIVSVSETAASATVNLSGYVETKWYAQSIAQPGELVRCSDHPAG